MAAQSLGAADRARVLGVMYVAREVYGEKGGWRLRGYLAAVTRGVKILGRKGGVVIGLHKYVVDRVVGLKGEVMDGVKETVVVEERCVLQPEEFESHEKRWPDGKTTASSRSRTVRAPTGRMCASSRVDWCFANSRWQCLVLVLEQEEAE